MTGRFHFCRRHHNGPGLQRQVRQHRWSRSLQALILSPPFQAALPVLLAIALPAVAAAPALAPASESQMTLYTRAAALNVCIARAAGVDFDKAATIAGDTIAQLIQGEHGGVIAVVGSQTLSIEELRKGSFNSAVIGAVEICPQQVPAEVLKKVQAALRQAAPNPVVAPSPRR